MQQGSAAIYDFITGPDMRKAIEDERFRGVNVHRPGEEVSLPELTLEIPQPRTLPFGLHAFGHHVHAQVLRQLHNRPHYLGGPVTLGHPADEGAVDLQRADGEALQVAQGRIARAEIVDAQLHAERPELFERVRSRLDVLHHHGHANITREDFERQKERFQREAREAGRKIGPGASDLWIWTKARAALAAAQDLRDSTVSVDVDNSVVTLTGTVASNEQKTKAGQVAKVEGATRVVNNLTVAAGGANANANTK
jgi:hypothetical protein